MTDINDETRKTNPLGSAAEEALKLFDAVQQRVGRELGKGLVKGGMSGFGAAFGSGRDSRTDDVWGEAVAENHDEEYICRACPICRVIAAQREHGAGGDLTGHLMAAGGELVAAFRQMVEGLQRSQPDDSRPDDRRVEHIDLG
ncbi:hypothetical protein [Sphaerimonospora thailandensis]|uniref:Uncharacterized protein n=1 Tax=Sphaerimonospora thailandensis TaxID=795644 RepID=A0A8J3RBU4_9ACTN|nr:hypothetical protein [Sphaerimonospora thailandensis]GIH70977.1 hypothetical protein Mth01_32300 [Sphaerimonospora thailandensis]